MSPDLPLVRRLLDLSGGRGGPGGEELLNVADYIPAGMAVPEMIALRPLGLKRPYRLNDPIPVTGMDNDIPAILNGLFPFGVLVECDARHLQEIGLFLNAAGVSGDLPGILKEFEEVQVAQWGRDDESPGILVGV